MTYQRPFYISREFWAKAIEASRHPKHAAYRGSVTPAPKPNRAQRRAAKRKTARE